MSTVWKSCFPWYLGFCTKISPHRILPYQFASVPNSPPPPPSVPGAWSPGGTLGCRMSWRGSMGILCPCACGARNPEVRWGVRTATHLRSVKPTPSSRADDSRCSPRVTHISAAPIVDSRPRNTLPTPEATWTLEPQPQVCALTRRRPITSRHPPSPSRLAQPPKGKETEVERERWAQEGEGGHRAVRGRWAPPRAEGEGPKGRAANGDRSIDTAGCRRVLSQCPLGQWPVEAVQTPSPPQCEGKATGAFPSPSRPCPRNGGRRPLPSSGSPHQPSHRGCPPPFKNNTPKRHAPPPPQFPKPNLPFGLWQLNGGYGPVEGGPTTEVRAAPLLFGGGPQPSLPSTQLRCSRWGGGPPAQSHH